MAEALAAQEGSCVSVADFIRPSSRRDCNVMAPVSACVMLDIEYMPVASTVLIIAPAVCTAGALPAADRPWNKVVVSSRRVTDLERGNVPFWELREYGECVFAFRHSRNTWKELKGILQKYCSQLENSKVLSPVSTNVIGI